MKILGLEIRKFKEKVEERTFYIFVEGPNIKNKKYNGCKI